MVLTVSFRTSHNANYANDCIFCMVYNTNYASAMEFRSRRFDCIFGMVYNTNYASSVPTFVSSVPTFVSSVPTFVEVGRAQKWSSSNQSHPRIVSDISETS